MGYQQSQRYVAICVCSILVIGLTACTSKMSSAQAGSVTPASSNEITMRPLVPPTFDPAKPRKMEGEGIPLFDAAMRDYANKAYGQAEVTLREATSKSPGAPEARFFLGICYLMTNDNEAAVSELKTAAALGPSAYLEDAHYFLAEAYARKRDAINASRELDEVIVGGGKRMEQARTLREVVNVTSH